MYELGHEGSKLETLTCKRTGIYVMSSDKYTLRTCKGCRICPVHYCFGLMEVGLSGRVQASTEKLAFMNLTNQRMKIFMYLYEWRLVRHCIELCAELHFGSASDRIRQPAVECVVILQRGEKLGMGLPRWSIP